MNETCLWISVVEGQWANTVGRDSLCHFWFGKPSVNKREGSRFSHRAKDANCPFCIAAIQLLYEMNPAWKAQHFGKVIVMQKSVFPQLRTP